MCIICMFNFGFVCNLSDVRYGLQGHLLTQMVKFQSGKVISGIEGPYQNVVITTHIFQIAIGVERYT